MSCHAEPSHTPDSAAALWVRHLSAVRTERVPLHLATGRVLAQPILADRPSPPSDVSAMDGYAVVLADCTGGALKVSGSILPGRPAPSWVPGQAMRIMTGAVVPPEADAVVKREDVDEHESHIVLQEGKSPRPGQNIRRRGENLAEGGTVTDRGVMVGSNIATSLASFGVADVEVYCKVRVAVLTTGDELMPAQAPVKPWQIRDSNGPALSAFLGLTPWVEWIATRHVADERGTLQDEVKKLLELCDVLILTGGVSAGTHDFVPGVIKDVGCRVLFHRLPIRPGAPVLGAVGPEGQAVMGLPGNPLSVMTTARRIGSVALRASAGFARPLEVRPVVTLTNTDSRSLHLWWFRPVRMTKNGLAEIVDTRGSGDVVSAAQSDGFVQIPPHETGPGPWPFYEWTM